MKYEPKDVLKELMIRNGLKTRHRTGPDEKI